MTEALTYNANGELATQLDKVGTTTVLSETYDAVVPRDALGRIQRKIEVVNGVTHQWDYGYDLAGRLQSVQLDAAAYESYSYDANGNRLTVVKPSGTTSATYDDQDRLLTYGPWTYTYTPNGELRTKSNASTGQSWTFGYDVFGNLKRVDLPGGDVVEYLVDGRNRRVGKKRNGVLVKQWLYGDQAASGGGARRERGVGFEVCLGFEEECAGFGDFRWRDLSRICRPPWLAARAREHDERRCCGDDAARCLGRRARRLCVGADTVWICGGDRRSGDGARPVWCEGL